MFGYLKTISLLTPLNCIGGVPRGEFCRIGSDDAHRRACCDG